MIKNDENFVFVNCFKGEIITRIKPTHELIKNRGYRAKFSQKFISFQLFLDNFFPIEFYTLLF